VVKHHADVGVQQQQPPAEVPAFDQGQDSVPDGRPTGKRLVLMGPVQGAHVVPVVRQEGVVDIQMEQGMLP
jgi:hypothetical protein